MREEEFQAPRCLGQGMVDDVTKRKCHTGHEDPEAKFNELMPNTAKFRENELTVVMQAGSLWHDALRP